jgi:hypothetical protein
VKKLVALLSLALLAAMAIPASAPASGLDGSWIEIRETPPDRSGGRGDHWRFYKSDAPRSVPDLNTQSGGLWLGCDGGQADWNNCVTGFDFWLQAGTCVRFYDGQNYSTLLRTVKAQSSAVSGFTALEGSSQDNRYTSFRWGDYVNLGGGNWSCQMGSYD